MAAPRKRRAVLDFSRAQAGDVATGDNAGGNITTDNRTGAQLPEVVDLVRAIFLDDTRRDNRQATIDRRLDRHDAFFVALGIGQVMIVSFLLVLLLLVIRL